MIPINNKEAKTAAKQNETAEEMKKASAAQREGSSPEVPEEEPCSAAETQEEADTGNAEKQTTKEENTAEEDTKEENTAGEDSGTAAGQGGLKGAFQNLKQKKELEKLKKELADKDKELAVLNDKYLRICAEYDNFRKRSQKEKESLYGDIRSNVITGFLPVFDNLERALAAHTEDEAYAKGVEMIMNQFNKTLEKLGVEEIPSLGQTFDPTLHNAVMHVDDEEKGENEIVEVFQKGFRIGDKIIRFSMVKVAN